MHSEQDRVPGEKLLEEQLKHFMDRSIERERDACMMTITFLS